MLKALLINRKEAPAAQAEFLNGSIYQALTYQSMAHIHVKKELMQHVAAREELQRHLDVLKEASSLLKSVQNAGDAPEFSKGMTAYCRNDSVNPVAPSEQPTTHGTADKEGGSTLFPVCMLPLTPHALLRARIVPSAFPLLHLGADFIAQLRIGKEQPAGPVSVTDSCALQADLQDLEFAKQVSVNGDKSDMPKDISIALTPRTGCLSVLQRRCLLLEQQLDTLNKRITSAQLVLGDTGLWVEAAANAESHGPSVSLPRESAGEFPPKGNSPTSSVHLTPEGFFEIREDITDEELASPQSSFPERLEMGHSHVETVALHEKDSDAAKLSCTGETAWCGGVRNAIIERDTYCTEGQSVQQKNDRPVSHFKRLMMQRQNQNPSL